VLRFELEGLENQQVERALDEVDGLDGVLPMIIDTITRVVSIIKGSISQRFAARISRTERGTRRRSAAVRYAETAEQGIVPLSAVFSYGTVTG